MSRPYASYRIDELESLVDDSASSDETLRAVQGELNHRTTARAKKLRALLNRRLSGSPVGQAESPSRPAARAGDQRSTHSVNKTTVTGPGAIQPSDACAALRETFTLESEILARWGVTTALPAEFLDLVMRSWRTILTDIPDQFGRTQERLTQDLQRIKAEREVLNL